MTKIIGAEKRLIGVDQVVKQEQMKVFTEDKKKKEKEGIRTTFLEWLKEPLPDLLELHNVSGHDMIIEIFSYRPNEDGGILLDQAGTKSSSLEHRTFGVAKILKAGDASPYAPGDIVKLADFTVASIENPDYEMWVNNEYSKSNMRKVGETPPKFINNLARFYSNKMILLNPLKTQLDDVDFLRFLIKPAEALYKLDSPEKFVQ